MEIIRHQTLGHSKAQQKNMYSRSVPPKPTKTGINSDNVEPSKINYNCNIKQTKKFEKKFESLETTERPEQKINALHHYSDGTATKRTLVSNEQNQSPSKQTKRKVQSSLRDYLTTPMSNNVPKTDFRTFNKQSKRKSQEDVGTQAPRHINISEIASLTTSRTKSQKLNLKMFLGSVTMYLFHLHHILSITTKHFLQSDNTR